MFRSEPPRMKKKQDKKLDYTSREEEELAYFFSGKYYNSKVISFLPFDFFFNFIKKKEKTNPVYSGQLQKRPVLSHITSRL